MKRAQRRERNRQAWHAVRAANGDPERGVVMNRRDARRLVYTSAPVPGWRAK